MEGVLWENEKRNF